MAHLLGLFDEFVVGLAAEWDGGAVRVNGSTGDVVDTDAALAFRVRQLNVGVLLTLLRKDLETNVDAEHVQIVFSLLFSEEIDGSGTGNLGLRGHGELFFGGDCPLIGSSKRGGKADK